MVLFKCKENEGIKKNGLVYINLKLIKLLQE